MLPGSSVSARWHGVCNKGGIQAGRVCLDAGQAPVAVIKGMFISSVTDRGPVPALVKTLAFNEARLRVIAENVANYDTPGYKAKRLDAKAFQKALRRALAERGDDPRKPLVIADTDQLSTGPDGMLRARPGDQPVENVLFHDRTNVSIERQMADLAETNVVYEQATSLLQNKYNGLRRAIRGRV
jgi:flagellar basal-body rod protein FlgB